MTFKDGVTTLPVEATTSWQANAEIGRVEGSTFIANPNLGNREATLQAQATFGGYTVSQDAALTVYCSHEKTHYAPQGAYHNKVCDLCGKIIGYKSAAKTPRLAVGMKAAFFYDFVDRHIDRIYNIDRLRRIFYV